MIKTKIIETTEKYDKDGKLVEKVTREETSEDDEMGNPIMSGGATWWDKIPTIPKLPLGGCIPKGENIKIIF